MIEKEFKNELIFDKLENFFKQSTQTNIEFSIQRPDIQHEEVIIFSKKNPCEITSSNFQHELLFSKFSSKTSLKQLIDLENQFVKSTTVEKHQNNEGKLENLSIEKLRGLCGDLEDEKSFNIELVLPKDLENSLNSIDKCNLKNNLGGVR